MDGRVWGDGGRNAPEQSDHECGGCGCTRKRQTVAMMVSGGRRLAVIGSCQGNNSYPAHGRGGI